MRNSHSKSELWSERQKLESRFQAVTATAGAFKSTLYASFKEQWSQAPSASQIASETTQANLPLTGAAGAINATLESSHIQDAEQQVREAYDESAA